MIISCYKSKLSLPIILYLYIIEKCWHLRASHHLIENYKIIIHPEHTVESRRKISKDFAPLPYYIRSTHACARIIAQSKLTLAH